MPKQQNPLTSSNAAECRMSATHLMDIMSTTLRESWGLLLITQTIENYELEPADKDEHWRLQAERHLEFLKVFGDYEERDPDFEFVPLEIAREVLSVEMQFQAKFDAEVRSFLNELSSESDHCLQEEVENVLRYLLTTQAAIASRLGEVLSELKSYPHHYAKQQAHDVLLTS